MSMRTDVFIISFVHGSAGPNDRPVSELRESLRSVERLYLLLFVVTVVSFVAWVVPK